MEERELEYLEKRVEDFLNTTKEKGEAGLYHLHHRQGHPPRVRAGGGPGDAPLRGGPHHGRRTMEKPSRGERALFLTPDAL